MIRHVQNTSYLQHNHCKREKHRDYFDVCFVYTVEDFDLRSHELWLNIYDLAVLISISLDNTESRLNTPPPYNPYGYT